MTDIRKVVKWVRKQGRRKERLRKQDLRKVKQIVQLRKQRDWEADKRIVRDHNFEKLQRAVRIKRKEEEKEMERQEQI